MTPMTRPSSDRRSRPSILGARGSTLVRLGLVAALLMSGIACTEAETVDDGSTVTYTETRVPCKNSNPLRNLYFGDLHFHTTHSWDAFGYDLLVTPKESYAFARGGSLQLPPLDASGKGTRTARLDRPLDFAAITDHAEFFGETHLCRTAGSSAYDTDACKAFRKGGEQAVTAWGLQLVSSSGTTRQSAICGADAQACLKAAGTVWQAIQAAAEEAYDRTDACSFVAFSGYEYTASPKVTNMHRNVLFRGSRVLPLPVTYYEQPRAYGLWQTLARDCLDAGQGCDVMVIPHNANWSNGMLFDPETAREGSTATLAEAMALRSRLEPTFELFQHKGDQECENKVSGLSGEADPLCTFEKLRFPPFGDCGDGTGFGGVQDAGCISRLDFLRGVLAQGLKLAASLGQNPLRIGVIGSTDSHNGTPGATWERGWQGHVGVSDDTTDERMGKGNMTHRGLVNNPGGLAAVWAVEKSRDAIFQALRRRETYATSGTRIGLRFFGGRGYAPSLCQGSPEAIPAAGYQGGVPMGGVLRGGSGGPPTFLVQAAWDPGTTNKPGTLLEKIQIIKISVDSAGLAKQQVFDVAGDKTGQGTVDPLTCKQNGAGYKTLCAVFTDTDFRAENRAVYYARVVEAPSCRWSTWECIGLSASQRPAGCDDTNVQKTIQERAWSSPIFYEP